MNASFEAGKPATVMRRQPGESAKPVETIMVKRVIKSFVETSDGRKWCPDDGGTYPKSRRPFGSYRRIFIIPESTEDIARRIQANEARTRIDQLSRFGYGDGIRALSDDAALEIVVRWERDVAEREAAK